ncbi:MAG: hypothetical protein WDN06_04690 [Asticcacaulis sp.]
MSARPQATFIIVVGDLSYLDAGHDPKGDNRAMPSSAMSFPA